MLFEKDWMMRQIKVLVRSIAQLIFHRDSADYTVQDAANLTVTDHLYKKLSDHLAQGRVCEAEDALFDKYLPGNTESLRQAIDFYQQLNEWSDDRLQASNFSRDEIYDGLRDIMAKSGMEFYGL